MSGQLYHTPAEIVTQLMIDLGLADGPETTNGLTGWTVFPLQFREDPEQALQVKDTAGRLHGRSQITGEAGEHYGIQVLARSSQDVSTPYKKIKAVLAFFDTQVRRESVTLFDQDNFMNRTYRVNAITRTSTAVPAGNDGRRFFYSGNALASIELASSMLTGTGS